MLQCVVAKTRFAFGNSDGASGFTLRILNDWPRKRRAEIQDRLPRGHSVREAQNSQEILGSIPHCLRAWKKKSGTLTSAATEVMDDFLWAGQHRFDAHCVSDQAVRHAARNQLLLLLRFGQVDEVCQERAFGGRIFFG